MIIMFIPYFFFNWHFFKKVKLYKWKIWKLRTKKSDIIFDKRVAIETCHCVYRDHTLYGIFRELCFTGFLFRPDNSECRVKLSIPVIRLSNDNRGTFTLHDHCVNKVLEGFLCSDKFFHDSGVDLLNPMWYFSFLILLITKNRFDCFIDNFFELLRRELDFLKLLWHCF